MARDLEQKIKAGTGKSKKAKTGTDIIVDTKIGKEWGNKKRKESRPKNKENPTRVQSFASRSFFLAVRLFFFFIIFFFKFVTT